jgi:hypothetical protein
MGLRIIPEPVAENDVVVVTGAGRKVALFYREYDGNGGVEEARRRAELFILAMNSAVEDAAGSAHTPGPWSVAEPDANGQPIVRAEHFEVATCWHHCVGSIEREARANARLIAAAPDLLAALKPFADLGVSSGPDDEWDTAPYRLTRGAIRAARAALAKASEPA